MDKPKFKIGQVVCVKDGEDILSGRPKYNPVRVISLPSEGSGWEYGLEGIYHTMDAPEANLRLLTKRERKL